MQGNGTPIDVNIEDLTSFGELMDPARRAVDNAKVLSSMKQDQHEREILQKCLKEQALGRMRDISRAEHLESEVVVTPRFAIRQGEKVRHALFKPVC